MKLSLRTGMTLMIVVALTSAVGADSTADSSLLDADKAWARAVANNEIEEFYGSIAEDVVLLAPNAPIAKGPDSFGALLALPAVVLNWRPVSADVADSGDLGYTYGTYDLSFDGPDGERVVDKGKYLTVWRKAADGSWKVVADMFNTSLPAAEVAAAGGGK